MIERKMRNLVLCCVLAVSTFAAAFPAAAQGQEQQQSQPGSQQTAAPQQSQPAQTDEEDQTKKSTEQQAGASSRNSPSQQNGTSQTATPPQTGAPQQNPSGTSNDRLFFTLPNFFTLENAGQVPPLTPGQKFKTTARGSFDPIEYFNYAFLAGVSQADDSDAGYGQGLKGYGKRYAAALATGTIENFMVGAIYPTVLRQDPRYFQDGKGSFFHRTLYAVSRIFVTRTDSGRSQFNFSEFMGSGSAASIATYSYAPSNDRIPSNVASTWGSQIALDTFSNVMKEFWPDIRRAIKKK